MAGQGGRLLAAACISTAIAVSAAGLRAVARQSPSAEVAGEAAFQRIVTSGAVEWEGDIEGKAAWTFTHFGAFLKQFPNHSRAGEARFRIAEATWANGGYPEAFRYIMTPGSWTDWRAKARYLEQWFDTRGFGGGTGPPPKEPDPKEATRARQLFLDVVTQHPTSPFAPMAMYYSAVILDYCLKDARSVAEYEGFVQKYPTLFLYVDKAKARIQALKVTRP